MRCSTNLLLILLAFFMAPASTLSLSELQAINTIARLSNQLAVDIHKKLSTGDANVFFSPLSISTALAMLLYGTRGKTAEEMKEALGYQGAGLTNSEINSAFRSLMKLFSENSATEEYLLYVANAILAQKDYHLLAEYKYGLAEIFKATAGEVDFENERKKAVEEINNWIKLKTNGHVDKLINKINPNTVMVLLNAVYFKGTWQTPFDPKHTKERVFFNKGLEAGRVQIPMMDLVKELPYARLRGVTVLELPYKTKHISMVILLPDAMDGLASLEQDLKSNILSVIKRFTRKTKVHVILPKFKLEYENTLKTALQELGVKNVFENSADLSGMSKASPLTVSEVIHKAVVEVNEEGSEASAVTEVIIETRRMGDSYSQFIANHPFFFVIVDKRNDLILFQGRVNKL